MGDCHSVLSHISRVTGNLLWHLGQLEDAFTCIQQSAKTYGKSCGVEDHRTLYLMKDCALIMLGHAPRSCFHPVCFCLPPTGPPGMDIIVTEFWGWMGAVGGGGGALRGPR